MAIKHAKYDQTLRLWQPTDKYYNYNQCLVLDYIPLSRNLIRPVSIS
jgi:hypothetical protein